MRNIPFIVGYLERAMSEENRTTEGLEEIGTKAEETGSEEMLADSDEYAYDASMYEDDDDQDQTPADEIQCPVLGQGDWEGSDEADGSDADSDDSMNGKTLAYPFGMMQAIMDSEQKDAPEGDEAAEETPKDEA